jgi:hypothetical protein
MGLKTPLAGFRKLELQKTRPAFRQALERRVRWGSRREIERRSGTDLLKEWLPFKVGTNSEKPLLIICIDARWGEKLSGIAVKMDIK